MPLPLETTPRRHLFPMIGAAFAAACFVGMDGVIKLMSPRYGAIQLAFFRFAGGSLFAVVLWTWQRSAMPSRGSWPLHLLRSVLLLVSIVGYFYALTRLPLALAVTISYLSPILVAVLAVPVLKERPSKWIWISLATGLAGVSIAVAPELTRAFEGIGAERLIGMASAALSALAFSGVMLLARHQAESDSIWTILLIQTVLPMLLLAGPTAVDWQAVHPGDPVLILLAGGLGTLGLLCLTYAFTQLEASRVVPFEYSSFVWAVLIGYLGFDELPTPSTVASALLVVGGCLLLLRR